MLNIEQIGEDLIVSNVHDFDVVHTFDCGQCFRWEKQEDGSYIGIAKGKITKVKANEKEALIFYNTSKSDFDDVWRDYLDLDRDYSTIKKIVSKDDKYMTEATNFGFGIHLLGQDMWETIVSFIISANNRIPQIKKTVKRISEKFGNPIEYEGKTYYTFPTPEKLACGTIEDFEGCGSGFRAKYIKSASEMIASSAIDIEKVKKMNFEEAMNELIKIPGVGKKVSSCVLLYGGQRYDAFPVDVWIKRIMESFYNANIKNLDSVYEYAYNKWDNLAGFAQQYLFYYAREKKINV